MSSLFDHSVVGLVLGVAGGALLVAIVLTALRGSAVYIPNTRFGLVERIWSRRRGVETYGLVTLNANPGFLPDTLRGGWHFFFPFMYRVHKYDLINVDQIAYLVARVGSPLREGQALAEWPAGVDVEDARSFLERGGQRGPQRQIVRSGTYAPNLALFCIVTADRIHTLGVGSSEDEDLQRLLASRDGFMPIVLKDDNIGIVTVQDGPSLQHGEIIAPSVGTDSASSQTFHNSFQDIAHFLAAGGRRGRQEQVLVDGTYYINRLFATVEIKPKTKIEIGTVGVVNSYVGPEVPSALIADSGRGRTVDTGQRGVWSKPYEPGKYAINTYAMEVVVVPTTNFQLRWMEGTTTKIDGLRNLSYDDDLKEIPVITKDAFEIMLPISIVAHISQANAAHVIQRFSQIQRLVNQTLDPFISSYFKDSAQEKTLIEFIQQRKQITEAALAAMKERLALHRIDIEEVMLGTPRPYDGDTRMERMLEQLRERQIATEQSLTFDQQKTAAMKKKDLNEQMAIAAQQPEVTKSRLAIAIAENEGEAEAKRRTKAAEGIKITADADAYAAEKKAAAFGGTENLMRRFAIETLGEAIREARQPLVPVVSLAGDAGGSGNGMLEGLMAAAFTGIDLRQAIDRQQPGRS
jgi:uncharacterized membrane protein YqiK